MPKSPAGPGGTLDLPIPKPAGGRAEIDLPMPKSVGGPGVDLPAPKGFFDDLPQPAKGGGRGADTSDVPAPKGFFDDLPQPARGAKAGAQPSQNDIAPKGFFDDLPQNATNRSGLPPPAGNEPPAPKGFFDDLPQPARGKEQSVAPRNAFGAGSIDLGDDPIEPMELALEEPALELDGPGAELDGPGVSLDGPVGGSFDQLDLSAPSTPQSRVGAEEAEKAGIKFAARKPGPPGAPTPDKATVPSYSRPNELALELEGGDKPKASRESQSLGPRKKEAPVVNEATLAKQRKRRRNVVAGLALGVALLGGGGFFLYKRHAAQQERADAISEGITSARKAMSADDPNHWQRAAMAATSVLELDPKHAEAYGIAAEASIAGALADGKTAPQRIAKGRKLIADALEAGITGPALDRAQALSALTTTPDNAPVKLQALLAQSPKDGPLALYLAWAYAANGNAPEAIKAYDRAIEIPSVKVLALVGRARAKLLLNDIPGARADFDAILAIDKDNIPAQVGLAATLPVSQSQQQESELLAILARKDVETADQRAVVQAWVLAADVARKGGRLDAARERYRKGLALDPKDLEGQTGLAEIELQEKKIEIAQELITAVLTISPNNAHAQLVQCEISLHHKNIEDAEQRIKLLAERDPPLPPLDGARLMIVKGKLHELRNQDEEAVAAYIEAAKLAGDRDLAPTFAAIAKLTQMAKAAGEANAPDKQAALRARSEELLATLSELAQKDPSLALTLANAYLQSGNAEKAEPWLRRVLEARPKDVDALYLLGKVLRQQGKSAGGVDKLIQARELAPTRAEIGLELARTFEMTGRDPEAAKLYTTLLQEPEPSLELRGHAGKFFVRTGKLAEAGEQGDKIFAADRQSAAGRYLRAEGLLAGGHLEEARKEFSAAVEFERDARHLDGLGRATESLSIQKNRDLALQDAALRAYTEAAKLDPTLFSPLLGSGRLYVSRREMKPAVNALLAANKLKSDDAEVAFNLGVAYRELGEKATKKVAVDWLRRSHKLRPSADTSFLLGQLFQDPDVNQVPGAIDSYKSATRLADEQIKKTGTAPTWYPEALYQLGDLANAIGDEGTACTAWRRYLVTTGVKNPKRVETVNRALATGLQGVCQ